MTQHYFENEHLTDAEYEELLEELTENGNEEGN